MNNQKQIDTHLFKMPNGKFQGKYITRVPVSYLKWMVNSRHQLADHAKAELERRGTVTPQIDISGHAIDRASQRLLPLWQKDLMPEEGLHAWLARRGYEAWQMICVTEKDKVEYLGVIWAFERDGDWPVLKTVMYKGER